VILLPRIVIPLTSEISIPLVSPGWADGRADLVTNDRAAENNTALTPVKNAGVAKIGNRVVGEVDRFVVVWCDRKDVKSVANLVLLILLITRAFVIVIGDVRVGDTSASIEKGDSGRTEGTAVVQRRRKV
jgi:hypothetical protein